MRTTTIIERRQRHNNTDDNTRQYYDLPTNTNDVANNNTNANDNENLNDNINDSTKRYTHTYECYEAGPCPPSPEHAAAHHQSADQPRAAPTPQHCGPK